MAPASSAQIPKMHLIILWLPLLAGLRPIEALTASVRTAAELARAFADSAVDDIVVQNSMNVAGIPSAGPYVGGGVYLSAGRSVTLRGDPDSCAGQNLDLAALSLRPSRGLCVLDGNGTVPGNDVPSGPDLTFPFASRHLAIDGQITISRLGFVGGRAGNWFGGSVFGGPGARVTVEDSVFYRNHIGAPRSYNRVAPQVLRRHLPTRSRLAPQRTKRALRPQNTRRDSGRRVRRDGRCNRHRPWQLHSPYPHCVP